MPVSYYFDSLEPVPFQRLINALLLARYGEAIRLLALRGRDGGRDAETAPPVFPLEVEVERGAGEQGSAVLLNPGRYIFQVKYHRTTDKPGTAVRGAVINDFEAELKKNILDKSPWDRANYFFLITNVPSSKEAVAKVDEKRRDLLVNTPRIHADVLWQEHVTSWLDQTPNTWHAFPELFAGNVVPLMGQLSYSAAQGLGRSVKLALSRQFSRDGIVRFRQINLEQSLPKLFVDLDARAPMVLRRAAAESIAADSIVRLSESDTGYRWTTEDTSCLGLLSSEGAQSGHYIILEGGPGQGKSTITQMLAQLYRAVLLNQQSDYGLFRASIRKARFPFRIELRLFAEWLGFTDRSIEEYLSEAFSKDAGGSSISVNDIHSIVEHQPVLVICDGLDEVGSDDQRDLVISKISECIGRFSGQLQPDLKVIITSRPPAIAGRADKLKDFQRIHISPLSDIKVATYVERWTAVQCIDSVDRERVVDSFDKRKSEEHVSALVKNPMQLSVLLHFIRLKGEAFPDRRAELYREYFRTVIDRDVEKSPMLRKSRDEIEAVHEVIGFEIHRRAESDAAAASLRYEQLIEIVKTWLEKQGKKAGLARDLFQLGEERLGLIVALRGEGADTSYGFEVQPVREYFAAAFINDKWESDAHDLFQAMVRRSFWREVALFLAGLRRANEKADLLSRARALDHDKLDGWRSDGRAIVLQLLQEGVLTAPGHVHGDAISFLLEPLDPRDPTPRHLSGDLLRSLPRLIRLADSEQHQKILEGYLENSLELCDPGALSNLWEVANHALPISIVGSHISKYPSHLPAAPLVKLLWPAQAGLDIAELVAQEAFLCESPEVRWAKPWYTAALLQSSLTRFEQTAAYHNLLFEQFAFQPLCQTRHSEKLKVLVPQKSFAIWCLCSNLQALANRIIGQDTSEEPCLNAQYDGLTKELVECAETLIEASAYALEHWSQGANRALKPLLQALEIFITGEGLPSWIASRCAVTMMQFAEGLQQMPHGGDYLLARRSSVVEKLTAWRQFRRNMTPLFRTAIPADVNRANQTYAAKILEFDLHRSCPSHVRIAGNLQSIPKLIAACSNGSQSPHSWIENVPIQPYWVGEMLDADNSMNWVSELVRRGMTWFGYNRQRNLHEMRILISHARQQNTPEILSGVLSTLLFSKFWNLIDVATLLKLIQADAGLLDVGARLLRRSSYISYDKATAVAEQIIKANSPASRTTASAAARFLFETQALKLPALNELSLFPAL